MQLKLSVLYQAKSSLDKLLTANLPIKTAYRLSRLVKSVNDELKTVEEMRNKLVAKYGEKKDGKITVLPENLETFFKEFETILQEEVVLSPEVKVSLEELSDIKLSPVDLNNLEFLLEEEQNGKVHPIQEGRQQ